MHYDNNKVTYSVEEIQKYKSKLINKCFAILGIYEDCNQTNKYIPYSTYLERIIIEFIGFNTNYENNNIISIINILTGMKNVEQLCHKDVKSLVFHIISIIQKMEV